MNQRTALYNLHIDAGASMVSFAGWDMPIHYGSLMDEHHAVRRAAGMFDVSHMTVIDIQGRGSQDYLRYLLANDVQRLKQPGKALYSVMLNEQGGVIDDLITYFLADGDYRLVVNAGTRQKDLDWLNAHLSGFDVTVTERPELALLAVQGPDARQRVADALALPAALDLGTFAAQRYGEHFIARTGYTGEDGFEIALPAEPAQVLWNQLQDFGVVPCGLGARDTLRLEAGMNLYGNDMDDSVSPLESGLGWTVVLNSERNFIGAEALRQQQQAGIERRLCGLILEDRGVMRAGQRIVTTEGDGVVTSGTFSPTLKRSIGLARLPAAATSVQVEVRGKLLAARCVKPPFVRNGATKIDL
jgi:aminomethyltransferase